MEIPGEGEYIPIGMMIVVATAAAALATTATGLPTGVRVCTNTACKKAGSADTLLSLRILASCADEASAAAEAGLTLSTVQAAFGASHVDSCGCLGGCGSGPNCVLIGSEVEDVLHDVYKPKSAVALLSMIGLTVPEPATKAWLRRMYAVRYP